MSTTSQYSRVAGAAAVITPNQYRYNKHGSEEARTLLGQLWKKIVRFRSFSWIQLMKVATPLAKIYYRNTKWKLADISFPYEVSCHNVTWTNERAVEISYAKMLLQKFEDSEVLEVGNVVRKYRSGRWLVCDKYEKKKGVLNKDVCDLSGIGKFNLILTISTLEHVGFDEPVYKEDGFVEAVAALRSLLLKNGELHCTVPLGYNPNVDQALQKNTAGFDTIRYFVRERWLDWRETASEHAFDRLYGHPFPCANAIAICVLRNRDEER